MYKQLNPNPQRVVITFKSDSGEVSSITLYDLMQDYGFEYGLSNVLLNENAKILAITVEE